jgi:hypothetical protein
MGYEEWNYVSPWREPYHAIAISTDARSAPERDCRGNHVNIDFGVLALSCAVVLLGFLRHIQAGRDRRTMGVLVEGKWVDEPLLGRNRRALHPQGLLANSRLPRISGLTMLAARAVSFVQMLGKLARKRKSSPRYQIWMGLRDCVLADEKDQRSARERFHPGGQDRPSARAGGRLVKSGGA